MRLIDADVLLYNLEGTMAVSPTGYIHGDTIVDMIGDAPTIEPDTDTISRKQTLEHLKKRLYESALNNDGIASYTFEEIADNRIQIWMDELPPSPSRPQWIPCSERLPEDGERVLATHLGGLNTDRQVIEHIYKNGEFTLGWDMDMNMDSPTFGQRYMGKVVAWMPLPEPYKGAEHE